MKKEQTEEKDYLLEYDKLSIDINVEKVSFEDAFQCCKMYIFHFLLNMEYLISIGIKEKLINLALNSINKSKESENKNKINDIECIKLWELYDKEKNSVNKHFLRIVITYFYNISSSDKKHYTAEDIFINFYQLLYELDPKLCKQFTDYIFLSCPLLSKQTP